MRDMAYPLHEARFVLPPHPPRSQRERHRVEGSPDEEGEDDRARHEDGEYGNRPQHGKDTEARASSRLGGAKMHRHT